MIDEKFNIEEPAIPDDRFPASVRLSQGHGGIFLLRFRNTRGRPWTGEGRLLLVCNFVAQSLGQRSQSGNGP